MKNKINMNHLTLLVLAMVAVILPFRDLLSEFVFGGFKILPDLIVGMYLLVFLYNKKLRIKFDTIDILYIGFLIVAFISTVFLNHEGIVRYILQIRSICLYYIVYYVLKNSTIEKEVFKKVSKVISILVFVLVGCAIIEVVTNKSFLYPDAWIEAIIYYDNFVRAYSLLGNPNTFAAFLIFAFILRYQLSDSYWTKENMPFTITAFLGIFLTISRSTIILLGVFLILCLCSYVYECKKEKLPFKANRYAILTILISLLCWGGVGFVNDAYLAITSSGSNDAPNVNRFSHMFDDDIIAESSSDGRIYNLKKGFAIFMENKALGTGFGTYGSSASLMTESKLVEKYDLTKEFYSDNEYIVILVETGIVGSLLFVAFMLAIAWRYRKDLFKLSFCVVFAGLGMFYNVLEVQNLAFLFWLCLAIPKNENLIETKLNHSTH